MIGYASRTGTRSTLDRLRRDGWRILVSAAGVQRNEGFSFAVDNGAWSAFRQGTAFDRGAFARCLATFYDCADWIVAPDIVCGGAASLELTRSWLADFPCYSPKSLIAVQDGMTPEHVADLVPNVRGLFVGGSSEWKESSLSTWGALKRSTGCYLHVGRVNTIRRLRLCIDAGADSFDGTGPVRFPCTLAKLTAEIRQSRLPLTVAEQ